MSTLRDGESVAMLTASHFGSHVEPDQREQAGSILPSAASGRHQKRVTVAVKLVGGKFWFGALALVLILTA